MANTVTITGVPELDRKLRTISNKLGKKFVRQGARRALKPVAATAKRLAPDNTGALKRSIKVKALGRSRKRFGSRVTTGVGTLKNSGGVYYGGFQEWGWTTNSGSHVLGQGFMHNAARMKQRSAVAIFTGYVRREIEAEARR